MTQIIRHSRAERDLLDIWQYVAAASGDERANALIHRIEQAFVMLSTQPEIGRKREELRYGLRTIPVGQYMIFYYPVESGIIIARVLFGKRDIEAAFREEEEDELDLPFA